MGRNGKMENEFMTYAPYIVIVVAYLIQNNIFVKPEQLEKKHREILEDMEKRFTSKSDFANMKEDVEEMKETINKIYNKLFEG